MRSYTFNRPITALFTAPLLLLLVMLVMGLLRSFNFMVLIVVLLTLLLTLPIIYLGFFRRMRLREKVAEWRTPVAKFDIPLDEVRYFGTVKYRMFRFIFVSREADRPFNDPTKPPVTGPDTFVIQFRRRAWMDLKAKIEAIHPQMKPIELTPR